MAEDLPSFFIYLNFFLQENTIWFSWDTIGKEAFLRVFIITTAMKKSVHST